MKLPLKVSRLTFRRTKVKYIIIHQTSEIYPAPAASIDNQKFQIPPLIGNILERGDPDINYHYILDRIGEDYQPIVCRPFPALCEWDDIDTNINNAAIHIALMGSYSLKIPEPRLYEVLAYRLINPFLKMFKLDPSRIKLHREVSNIEDLDCPGDFVEKEKIVAMVRRFVIK